MNHVLFNFLTFSLDKEQFGHFRIKLYNDQWYIINKIILFILTLTIIINLTYFLIPIFPTNKRAATDSYLTNDSSPWSFTWTNHREGNKVNNQWNKRMEIFSPIADLQFIYADFYFTQIKITAFGAVRSWILLFSVVVCVMFVIYWTIF